MPTACGIETLLRPTTDCVRYGAVATVPTACGIETFLIMAKDFVAEPTVATVPTACGIETYRCSPGITESLPCCNSAYRLRY